MPRELSTAVEAAKISTSVTYFDSIEIRLPFGPGDTVPRVLNLSTAEIEVTPPLDFAEFIYRAFAGASARVHTAAEHADWLDALLTGQMTSEAALKTAAADLLDDLFTTTEYDDRIRSDEQFVTDVYAAYLGRIAEPGGKAFWVSEVVAHDRATVRNAFAASSEFAERIERMSQPVANEPDTRDMGDLTFNEGAAIDGVEFALTNVENTYSDLIGQAGRRLYPAPAIVKRAFKLPDGSYESVEMLIGFAKFSSVDGVNAKVTITSDLNRRGVDVIETITQHCINIYKMEGCDSPDASPTCSRIKDDAVNGCAAKAPAPQLVDISPPDNRPSFKGIVQSSMTPSTGVGIDPGDVGPGGWPGDYDPNNPLLRKFAQWYYNAN